MPSRRSCLGGWPEGVEPPPDILPLGSLSGSVVGIGLAFGSFSASSPILASMSSSISPASWPSRERFPLGCFSRPSSRPRAYRGDVTWSDSDRVLPPRARARTGETFSTFHDASLILLAPAAWGTQKRIKMIRFFRPLAPAPREAPL
jgi:hypothetical protein